eukprot:896950-Prymnesium_polylepis.1
MASRGPLRPRAGYTQRGLQRRAVRGEKRMEMTHIHALFKSALVQAAHQLRTTAAALQSRWPTVSMMQNISDDLLDGGAVPHDLTDDAGDRACSLDDDKQCAGGAARSALALLAPPCG